MLSCLFNLKILVLVKVYIAILYCNVTTQQWVKEDSYTAADCILNWLATPAVAPSSAHTSQWQAVRQSLCWTFLHLLHAIFSGSPTLHTHFNDSPSLDQGTSFPSQFFATWSRSLLFTGRGSIVVHVCSYLACFWP